MRFSSNTVLLGFMLTVGAPAHFAQGQLPDVSGLQSQVGSQGSSLTAAAKNALDNVKSAQTQIGKKDYLGAKTSISSAQENLKSIEGSVGASPVSQTQKTLGEAKGALDKNQPKAADNLLKQATGLLQSMS